MSKIEFRTGSHCGCYEHQEEPPPASAVPGRSPGVGALVAALHVTSLVDDGAERPALDIAIELIAALGGQGWRLIHD